MSKRKSQPFACSVVNEMVQISLMKRRGRGFTGEAYDFIQCDQIDCQYVDDNIPPCPVHLDLFSTDDSAIEHEEQLEDQ